MVARSNAFSGNRRCHVETDTQRRCQKTYLRQNHEQNPELHRIDPQRYEHRQKDRRQQDDRAQGFHEHANEYEKRGDEQQHDEGIRRQKGYRVDVNAEP